MRTGKGQNLAEEEVILQERALVPEEREPHCRMKTG
jgi:hypothetical protein